MPLERLRDGRVRELVRRGTVHRHVGEVVHARDREALRADPNVKLVAMCDAFMDRLQASLANLKNIKDIAAKIDVAPDRCFDGFDGYKKLLDSGVDVVLLTTPPGFRPIHLRAAVEAGKHVFCEKPVAVDVPGVKSVIESASTRKMG